MKPSLASYEPHHETFFENRTILLLKTCGCTPLKALAAKRTLLALWFLFLSFLASSSRTLGVFLLQSLLSTTTHKLPRHSQALSHYGFTTSGAGFPGRIQCSHLPLYSGQFLVPLYLTNTGLVVMLTWPI